MNHHTYEIIPRLFLSSYDTAENFQIIKQLQISTIVNCSKDLDNKFELRLIKPIEEAPKEIQDYLFNNAFIIKYYRIPIDDNMKKEEIDHFYKYSKDTIPKIIDEYNSGKNILIHCLAGNQRSAAFVVIFLMKYLSITSQQAIEKVLDKKPNSFFFGSQINFIDAINKFEESIQN